MNIRLIARIFWGLAAVISPTCLALNISELQPADYSNIKLLGSLQNSSLKEVSGITRSTLNDKVFWVINDGGDKPYIYAIDSNGKHLGRYFIRKVDNRDWEDISSYSKDGKHYLIIADTGDNDASHRDSFLWVVVEPNLDRYNPKKLNTLGVKQRIRFRYKDGPRDCEAIAVDLKKDRILLLSKRTVPAVMYQLPISPDPKQRMLTAKPVAEVGNIPQPDFTFLLTNPFFGRYASQPTAMDISPDGSQLAILTYNYGYIYKLEKNEEWEQALKLKPLVFKLPELRQAEALGFSQDGNIIVTSEKRPAPLYLIEKKSASQTIE